mgnify:CR=1 FL=1
MKKILFLITSLLILGLIFVGCNGDFNFTTPGTTETGCVNCLPRNPGGNGEICISFETTKLAEGDSVEGERTVNDWLNIQLDSGSKKLILVEKETDNEDFLAYRANVSTNNDTNNGCLDGSWGFAACPADDSSKRLAIDDEIVFSFPGGVTVSNFSIDMFDFGDWYPGGGSGPVNVILTDQDAHSVEYIFDASAAAKYDACGGTDGKKTLEISYPGITEVTLSFSGKMDPGIAFDNICFTPETLTCSTELQAGNPKDGDNIVGDVKVKYIPGDDYVSVEYSTDAPWLMEEIHFHASFDEPGSWGKPVVNKAGNPAPGHFLKVIEDLGGKNSHSFEISLSEIDSTGCGPLYFAAHAKVYWIDNSIVPVVLNSEEGSDEVYLFKSTPNTDWSNHELDYPVSAIEVSYGSWNSKINEGIFGAKWISDDQLWGSDTYNYWWGSHVDSWRLFERVFDIPLNAVNILGTLEATADNEEEVYINGSLVTPSIDYSANWEYFSSYDLPLITGDNNLEIMVKNNTGTGYNPTGLIYKLEYQYDLKYEETAWGDGKDFPRAKNWSMYFECPLLVPCPF